MQRIGHCIAVLLLLAAGLGNASQEGILLLGSFRVESPGIGSSGPVTVFGSQGAKGIDSLSVEAFGKRFTLTQDQLKSLRGVAVNGLQFSYEGGYQELGGRTLYLVFTTGFTSGVTQRRRIVIKENGSVEAKVE